MSMNRVRRLKEEIGFFRVLEHLFRQRLLIRSGFIVLALGIAATGQGCSEDKEVPKDEAARPAVRLARVKRQDIMVKKGYVATVRSRREVKVIARIFGKLSWIAEEGESFRPGQKLARIAAHEIGARIHRIGAKVQRAVTERDFFCRSLSRDQDLGSKGAIPPVKVDLSRRACNSAKAVLRAALASRSEAEAAKGKTREDAPLDGFVLRRLAAEGQNVMPGTPLLILGGRELELRLLVAQSDVMSGIGARSVAIVQLPRATIRTRISHLAPMTSGRTRSVQARIPLAGKNSRELKNGMSIRVDLVLAEVKDALVVPLEALGRLRGKPCVFVAEGDEVRAVPVTLNIKQERLIGLTGALDEDALVAVSNLELLKDGSKIFAVRPAGGQLGISR